MKLIVKLSWTKTRLIIILSFISYFNIIKFFFLFLIQKRTKLNDFDRFKLRYAKRQRNKMLTIAFNALKKRTKEDGTQRKFKERVRPGTTKKSPKATTAI